MTWPRRVRRRRSWRIRKCTVELMVLPKRLAGCVGPIAVAIALGCSDRPARSHSADGSGGREGSFAMSGSGGRSGVHSGSDGGRGVPNEGVATGTQGARDAATIFDASARGGDAAAPKMDVALTDQPGTRSWQCKVAREPSALGIAPWAGGDLAAADQGIALLRAEGGTPEPGGFVGERLVVSSLGTDGELGSPTALANESGMQYALRSLDQVAGRSRAFYSSASSASAVAYVAQELGADGQPTGTATSLVLDASATSATFMSRDDGYLVLGRVYDAVRTDNGSLWTQELDSTGKPLGSPNAFVQATSAQRMAELAAAGPARTDSGFLVLYRWFAATAQTVDISHYHFRFQALDRHGRAAGSANELAPELGTQIIGSPQLLAHGSEVLAAWTEVEHKPDPSSPMGWSGAPLWSAVRVGRFDTSGAALGPIRSVAVVVPQGSQSGDGMAPYWIDLGADEIGLGWFDQETDFASCPSCSLVGTNNFVVLAADLQSAQSVVVTFALQTQDAGFIAHTAARSGNDLLVVGDLTHNLWEEGASATLHCTH
jgi:hypothetical protein